MLTVNLLLGCPECNLVRRGDRVGGRFPAGLWQQRTRGSIYKIDVVLSASASYCGNHIPISTKNKTHHLPLPRLPLQPGLSLQTILIFQHQISNFSSIFTGICHGFSALAYRPVCICPRSSDNKFSGFLIVLVLCWEHHGASVSQCGIIKLLPIVFKNISMRKKQHSQIVGLLWSQWWCSNQLALSLRCC